MFSARAYISSSTRDTMNLANITMYEAEILRSAFATIFLKLSAGTFKCWIAFSTIKSNLPTWALVANDTQLFMFCMTAYPVPLAPTFAAERTVRHFSDIIMWPALFHLFQCESTFNFWLDLNHSSHFIGINRMGKGARSCFSSMKTEVSPRVTLFSLDLTILTDAKLISVPFHSHLLNGINCRWFVALWFRGRSDPVSLNSLIPSGTECHCIRIRFVLPSQSRRTIDHSLAGRLLHNLRKPFAQSMKLRKAVVISR